MRISLRVAGQTLLVAVRNPRNLIFALLLPLVVTVLMGSLSPGTASQAVTPAAVLIVNDDTAVTRPAPAGAAPDGVPHQIAYGAAISEALSAYPEALTPSAATDLAAAQDLVAAGKATAVIHIPSTFTADALAGRESTISVTTDPGDQTRGAMVTEIVRSLAEGFSSRLLVARSGLAESDASRMLEITVATAGVNPVSAMQYYAVVTSLMFILVLSLMQGGQLIEERVGGTLGRMLTAPVRKGQVVGGWIIGSALISLIQFALLLVGTRLLLGVTWGPWPSAVLLGAAYALAATGIGALAAGVLKSRKAADQTSGILGNLAGALSGSLIPIYSLPGAIKAIGRLTPNYWALQGFLDQMAGVGHGRLWLPVAVLVATGIVTGAVGSWRLSAK